MTTALFTTPTGSTVIVDSTNVDCIYPLAGPSSACRVYCADGAVVDVASTLAAAVAALDLAASTLPRAAGSGTAAAGASCAVVRGAALGFQGTGASRCAISLRGGHVVTVETDAVTASTSASGVGGSGGTVAIVGAFFGDGVGGAPVQAPAAIVTPQAYTPGSGDYVYDYVGAVTSGTQLLVWASSPSDDVVVQTARVVGSEITIKVRDGAGAPTDRLHVVFIAAVQL